MNLDLVSYCAPKAGCPFEDFLRKYKTKGEGDRKRMARVLYILQHTAEHGGIAGGTYSEPMTPWQFQAVRIKEGTRVARVHYMVHDGKLVLLNAYHKPARYDPRRLAAYIAAMRQEAEALQGAFLRNPRLYKKFP